MPPRRSRSGSADRHTLRPRPPERHTVGTAFRPCDLSRATRGVAWKRSASCRRILVSAFCDGTQGSGNPVRIAVIFQLTEPYAVWPRSHMGDQRGSSPENPVSLFTGVNCYFIKLSVVRRSRGVPPPGPALPRGILTAGPGVPRQAHSRLPLLFIGNFSQNFSLFSRKNFLYAKFILS